MLVDRRNSTGSLKILIQNFKLAARETFLSGFTNPITFYIEAMIQNNNHVSLS